jgi:hypothetical protein
MWAGSGARAARTSTIFTPASDAKCCTAAEEARSGVVRDDGGLGCGVCALVAGSAHTRRRRRRHGDL